MKVLLERFPYRFCEDTERGYIQKYSMTIKRYTHMYECDSQLQLATAMGDIDYVKWLDPENPPCYNNRSRVVNPYV